MTEYYPGSCLCGAVKYEVHGPFEGFHLCHCSRCRKATSSAHASNLFTQPGNIRWLSGEAHRRRFELPEAKRFARSFCEVCGSGLPYVNRPGTALVIPTGTLDRDPGVIPEDHIFWQDRTPWYDAAVDVPKYDAYPAE